MEQHLFELWPFYLILTFGLWYHIGLLDFCNISLEKVAFIDPTKPVKE